MKQCSSYLPTDEEGEVIIFRGIKVHQQEELHQIYARTNLGSGSVSGARPVGPKTAAPRPNDVHQAHRPETVVTTPETVVTTVVTKHISDRLHSHPRGGQGKQKVSSKQRLGHKVRKL